AFGIMGADPLADDARRSVRWLADRLSVNSVKTVKGGTLSVSRRDLHAEVFGGSRSVGEVDQLLDLLVRHGYLRPAVAQERQGRGRAPSPRYDVNPILAQDSDRAPPFTVSQNSQKEASADERGDAWEGSD